MASLYGAIPYVKCVHLGPNTDLCSLALWPNLFVRETDFPDTLLCLGRIYKKIQENRSNKIMVAFYTCKNQLHKVPFQLKLYDLDLRWNSLVFRCNQNFGKNCSIIQIKYWMHLSVIWSRWWKTFSWGFLIIQIITLKDLFLGNFLKLNILIFLVNYFCLQNKLFVLMAISF